MPGSGPRLRPQPGRDLVLRQRRAASRHRARRPTSPRHGKYDTPASRRSAIPAFGASPAGSASSRPAAGRDPRARPGASTSTRAGQDFLARLERREPGQFRPGFPRPSTTSSSSPARRSPTSTALPGEEVLGGTASASTSTPSTPPATAAAGLAEADRRLDGRQPADRLASARATPTPAPARSVIGDDPLRATLLAYDDRRAAPARPARGRASTTTTPTRATTSATRRCPGAATASSSTAPRMSFKAPGDDLLCGTRRPLRGGHLERPIDETNFQAAEPLSGAPAPARPWR